MTHVTRQPAANCHAAQLVETNTLRRGLLEPRGEMTTGGYVAATFVVIFAILGFVGWWSALPEPNEIAQHMEASR